MSNATRRIMIAGDFQSEATLESSYKKAFETIGYEVIPFDIEKALHRYIRLGRVGRTFNSFVSVQTWVRKANRELIIKTLEQRPVLLIVVGGGHIQPGALAQIKTSTNTALVFIWPDTLLNLPEEALANLRIFDLVACYSAAAVQVFQKFGANDVAWVPLAADPSLHPRLNQVDTKSVFHTDISFIGGWRPEREEVLTQLDSFQLKIWGPDWDQRCARNQVIMKVWQGRALYGVEFARAVAASKINLNIIDRTNYPAANMRFFEIPAAGGLQVSSPCPEMEDEFRQGKELFYYEDIRQLKDTLNRLLHDDALRIEVAKAAHAKVMQSHTYSHRARRILELCGLRAYEENGSRHLLQQP